MKSNSSIRPISVLCCALLALAFGLTCHVSQASGGNSTGSVPADNEACRGAMSGTDGSWRQKLETATTQASLLTLYEEARAGNDLHPRDVLAFADKVITARSIALSKDQKRTLQLLIDDCNTNLDSYSLPEFVRVLQSWALVLTPDATVQKRATEALSKLAKKAKATEDYFAFVDAVTILTRAGYFDTAELFDSWKNAIQAAFHTRLTNPPQNGGRKPWIQMGWNLAMQGIPKNQPALWRLWIEVLESFSPIESSGETTLFLEIESLLQADGLRPLPHSWKKQPRPNQDASAYREGMQLAASTLGLNLEEKQFPALDLPLWIVDLGEGKKVIYYPQDDKAFLRGLFYRMGLPAITLPQELLRLAKVENNPYRFVEKFAKHKTNKIGQKLLADPAYQTLVNQLEGRFRKAISGNSQFLQLLVSESKSGTPIGRSTTCSWIEALTEGLSPSIPRAETESRISVFQQLMEPIHRNYESLRGSEINTILNFLVQSGYHDRTVLAGLVKSATNLLQAQQISLPQTADFLAGLAEFQYRDDALFEAIQTRVKNDLILRSWTGKSPKEMDYLWKRPLERLLWAAVILGYQYTSADFLASIASEIYSLTITRKASHTDTMMYHALLALADAHPESGPGQELARANEFEIVSRAASRLEEKVRKWLDHLNLPYEVPKNAVLGYQIDLLFKLADGKIDLEIDGPMKFASGPSGAILRGRYMLRDRNLGRAGYKVLRMNFSLIDKMENAKELENWMRSEFKKEGIPWPW